MKGMIVAGIFLIIGLGFIGSALLNPPPPVRDYSQHASSYKRFRTDMEHLLKAPVVENEGLVTPVIDGDARDYVIAIWHQGPRYLNPSTIEHWRKLNGVIAIEEHEYHVLLKKSDNFEWEQIFHPERYIPGWEWKKD